MKPTNEELFDKYAKKLEACKRKQTDVQDFYSKLLLEPSDSLEYEIKVQGCKIMLCNLVGHNTHCREQLAKFR